MNSSAARSRRRWRVPADFGVFGGGGGTKGRTEAGNPTEVDIRVSRQAMEFWRDISIPLEYSPVVEKAVIGGKPCSDVLEP